MLRNIPQKLAISSIFGCELLLDESNSRLYGELKFYLFPCDGATRSPKSHWQRGRKGLGRVLGHRGLNSLCIQGVYIRVVSKRLISLSTSLALYSPYLTIFLFGPFQALLSLPLLKTFSLFIEPAFIAIQFIFWFRFSVFFQKLLYMFSKFLEIFLYKDRNF